MSWLSWIVVGFVAGALAKTVTGVRLFKAAGGEGVNRFSLYSLLVAFIGATVLLFIWGALTGRDRERY